MPKAAVELQANGYCMLHHMVSLMFKCGVELVIECGRRDKTRIWKAGFEQAIK